MPNREEGEQTAHTGGFRTVFVNNSRFALGAAPGSRKLENQKSRVSAGNE